jgi:transposase-like protein
MPMLSYLHQLFNIDQCHAYIHTLRWKDRPLHCPRCQSHDVGPWGNYHYRPGLKRYWCNGCQRTFNDLTHTLLHQSKRALPYWILATFLLCLACSSRRIANSKAPLKPMTSTILLATRGKQSRAGRRRWDAARGGVARSANPAGATTIKTGRPLSPGSVVRGLSSSRDPGFHGKDGAEGR